MMLQFVLGAIKSDMVIIMASFGMSVMALHFQPVVTRYMVGIRCQN